MKLNVGTYSSSSTHIFPEVCTSSAVHFFFSLLFSSTTDAMEVDDHPPAEQATAELSLERFDTSN